MALAKPANRSRYIQFISGIQGISPGGNATILAAKSRRYHRMKFRCQGEIAFTGGAGLLTSQVNVANRTAAGLTVTPTVAAGQITALAIVVGGANYAVGDTFQILNDATGSGGLGTVTTVAAGVVTAATWANVGPIDPRSFFTSFRLVVGGTTVRDVLPDTTLKLAIARRIVPGLGEFPIFFTEPDRNFLQNNDITSWQIDQQNFEILMGINPLILNPTLAGSQEFDFLQNAYPSGGGKFTHFNNAIKYREQNFAVGAGTTDLNQLSYVGAIQRIWLLGSTPGQITRLEVYQDGEKRLEATIDDLKTMYQDYGYQFGRNNFENQNQPGALLKGQADPLSYFDACYLADPDGRLSDALNVSSELIVRVFSNVAQTMKVVMETAPGAYA